MLAALAAKLPGFEIAEIEQEGNGVYEIEGLVDGQKTEVKIKPDGQILKIDSESRDDDHEEEEGEDDLPLTVDHLPQEVLDALAAELRDFRDRTGRRRRL